MADCRGMRGVLLARSWIVNWYEEYMVGTENNESMETPVPAPPTGPAGASPSVSGDPGVAFTPMSAAGRKRVKLIGILVGVLVVLVIAGVVAIKVANSSRTPEAQVRQYLDLLAAGNASAATAMVDPGVANDERVFLTDSVMSSAQSLLVVEDISAGEGENGGKKGESDTRTVTATMQVNGERFVHEFTVVKTKPTMGVLDNWQVKDALVSQVSVDARGYNQFTVGDVTADAHRKEQGSNDATFLFYPGVYTFTPVAASEYADSNPETVSILGDTWSGDGTTVSLTATYNTKLTAAALDAGKEVVDSCASIPGNQNSVCPFAIQSDAVTAVSGAMPKAIGPVSADQPTFFRASVTFTATYSNKYYMEGTRDVEAKVEVIAQLDDNDVLILDKDGKPDFTVDFTR